MSNSDNTLDALRRRIEVLEADNAFLTWLNNQKEEELNKSISKYASLVVRFDEVVKEKNEASNLVFRLLAQQKKNKEQGSG